MVGKEIVVGNRSRAIAVPFAAAFSSGIGARVSRDLAVADVSIKESGRDVRLATGEALVWESEDMLRISDPGVVARDDRYGREDTDVTDLAFRIEVAEDKDDELNESDEPAVTLEAGLLLRLRTLIECVASVFAVDFPSEKMRLLSGSLPVCNASGISELSLAAAGLFLYTSLPMPDRP